MYRSFFSGIFLLSLFLIVISCDSSNTYSNSVPKKNDKVEFGLDHLPKIVDNRVYSDSGKFSFEIPSNWRIEPIPVHIWKKDIADKREDMLLRPILSESSFPNIRIVRFQQLVFNPELFISNKKGAAIHLLDQFFGGKWKKEILSDPVLDLDNKRFSFVFKIAPMFDQHQEAHFFFRKDYTLMILGAFVSDKKRLSNAPLSYVIKTLRFYDR